MVKLFLPRECPQWMHVVAQGIERLLGTAGNMPEHSKAQLPSPAGAKRWIYVTDEIGGAVPAFNDGSAWRRATDRAIVS
jgi:hypothetical protein